MMQDFRGLYTCAPFDLQIEYNDHITVEDLTLENYERRCVANFFQSLDDGELEAREFITDDYAPMHKQGDVVIFGWHFWDQWGAFALVQVCNEAGEVFHEVSGILIFSSQWSATIEDATGQRITVRSEDFETEETGALTITVKTPIKKSRFRNFSLNSQ